MSEADTTSSMFSNETLWPINSNNGPENPAPKFECPFFVPLPFETTRTNCEVERLELSDIDLSENLSDASLDLDNLGQVSYDEGYWEDYHVKLPPMNTIWKGGIDFAEMLRNSASDALGVENQVIPCSFT